MSSNHCESKHLIPVWLPGKADLQLSFGICLQTPRHTLENYLEKIFFLNFRIGLIFAYKVTGGTIL